jgi:hypothetical protein
MRSLYSGETAAGRSRRRVPDSAIGPYVLVTGHGVPQDELPGVSGCLTAEWHAWGRSRYLPASAVVRRGYAVFVCVVVADQAARAQEVPDAGVGDAGAVHGVPCPYGQGTQKMSPEGTPGKHQS